MARISVKEIIIKLTNYFVRQINPGRVGLPYTHFLQGECGCQLQVCKFLDGGAQRHWIESQQVPYAVKGDQWVGYDDERSIGIKVRTRPTMRPDRQYTSAISPKNLISTNDSCESRAALPFGYVSHIYNQTSLFRVLPRIPYNPN